MEEYTEYVIEHIENRIVTAANVSEKLFVLEESLNGKENLIKNLMQENEQLKNKLQLSDENLEELNLPIPGRGVLSTLEQYHSKLDEFENALHERDDAIKVLTRSLKLMTENRDNLQVEYTVQVDQLASQIQTLQSQLRQADEWLNNPIGEGPMLALLEAKNEIIAQQEDCKVKELQVKILKEESKKYELHIESLKINLDQSDERIIIFEQKIEDLQALNDKLKAQLELNISVQTSEITSSDIYISSLKSQLHNIQIELEKSQLNNKSALDENNLTIEKLKRENALYISMIEELRSQAGLLELETSILVEKQNNVSRKTSNEMVNLSRLNSNLKTDIESQTDITLEHDTMTKNKLDDIQNELMNQKDEIQKLREERDAKILESANWKDQYLLLSRQNVSSAELIGDVASLLQKNEELKAEAKLLKSQLKASEINVLRCQNSTGLSSEIFEKGLDELKLLKQTNMTLEDSFLSNENYEIKLKKELQIIMDERDEFYGREIQKLNEEMKNFALAEKNKKEKSTDCDSALIPLLCVHG